MTTYCHIISQIITVYITRYFPIYGGRDVFSCTNTYFAANDLSTCAPLSTSLLPEQFAIYS